MAFGFICRNIDKHLVSYVVILLSAIGLCNVVADCLASFGACLNVGNSRLWLDQAAEFVIPLVSSDLPKPVGIVFPSQKKCFLK
jgi:hypothetical protein